MTISVCLNLEVEARLDHLVDIAGRAKSYYLIELILMSLEDLEDFYLADSTMERIRKGQEVIHSSDSVRKELYLDR
ncbi:CopG family transcriptional regulator [Ferrovum sp. PN-J185]|uniref:type II toxin-antitoxin system RelB family antitoxin n=1 Tax=Ferrovum sp. PN-J185 TaxID=1356306 RepID=UPI001E29401F|nr:CopG family transcriptional regulator [Ferrovum sp. PN-J185]MCC6067650.1 CopG family transcriptional regulator [Ferrovum sp. PN-J185]